MERASPDCRAGLVAMSNAITSIRQAAEWGKGQPRNVFGCSSCLYLLTLWFAAEGSKTYIAFTTYEFDALESARYVLCFTLRNDKQRFIATSFSTHEHRHQLLMPLPPLLPLLPIPLLSLRPFFPPLGLPLLLISPPLGLPRLPLRTLLLPLSLPLLPLTTGRRQGGTRSAVGRLSGDCGLDEVGLQAARAGDWRLDARAPEPYRA